MNLISSTFSKNNRWKNESYADWRSTQGSKKPTLREWRWNWSVDVLEMIRCDLEMFGCVGVRMLGMTWKVLCRWPYKR